MDAALREGYETSRRMQRRHDPTYYFATRRLPAEIRPATHALYGYVRTADQIVDGPRRPATPDGRRAALDAWEAELEAGETSCQPIVRALTDAAARHRLPLGELRTYMRSMRIDCAPVRIASWDDLVAYMDGSAGSVGRIMASLLGVPARHHSDLGRLGLAFQLANFIRDVREDATLDRVYLPAEDRDRFGVTEQDLRAEHATPAVRALVAHEVERARGLFAGARPAIASAPASVRPGMKLATGLYSRMLDRVEATGFDVLGRETGVRVWHIPGAALEALR
ncbi:phytoene/squalene synthase family protein [Solirubrobacter ginsenosidimutans]|uniref:Phytoene/squalene synthase family protein n=1 Tax=Solirubrobacter ginsenosidimutans TaxID=490573 RepID=A0A9X3MY66_9ACTN|nr:phytoene/squalene synthase family protein [Solirubrobacter ginsenosidimutans]MDA0163533.1 phytoene/squalene synthase family protein [Solirubrobacter ginsenosidimutans]